MLSSDGRGTERERERETDRQTDTETERDRDRERQRQRERDRDRERQRDGGQGREMEGDTWVVKMVAKTLRWTETGRETEIWRQKRERDRHKSSLQTQRTS